MNRSRQVWVVLAALVVFGACGIANAGVVDSYYLDETYSVPTVAMGSYFTAVDVLADGRNIALTGSDVYVETAVGSREFEVVATIDSSVASMVDPSFLKVSPDGGQIALGVGWGQPLCVVDTSVLGTAASPTVLTDAASGGNTKCFSGVNYYDAEWQDSSHLVIDGGGFSYSDVVVLDVTSSVSAPDVVTVVTGIDGASAGVTVGPDGALYTGNGYHTTDTGLIRRFEASDVAAAVASGTPLDWATDGLDIIDALSAASLGFDSYGNLYVGGGDAFGGSGDVGYFGLLSASALAEIVAGDPFDAADYGDGSKWAMFNPEGTGSVLSYMVNFNAVTGELLGIWSAGYSSGGSPVYASSYVVPTPTALILASIGSAFALFRRRRKRVA